MMFSVQFKLNYKVEENYEFICLHLFSKNGRSIFKQKMKRPFSKQKMDPYGLGKIVFRMDMYRHSSIPVTKYQALEQSL